VGTRNGPFGVYTFNDNRGRIGVIVDTRANAAGDKVGARIDGVTPSGPAEKAGLKPDDLIVYVDGEKIVSIKEFKNIIDKGQPGSVFKLEVRRGDKLTSIDLKLEEAKKP